MIEAELRLAPRDCPFLLARFTWGESFWKSKVSPVTGRHAWHVSRHYVIFGKTEQLHPHANGLIVKGSESAPPGALIDLTGEREWVPSRHRDRFQ